MLYFGIRQNLLDVVIPGLKLQSLHEKLQEGTGGCKTQKSLDKEVVPDSSTRKQLLDEDIKLGWAVQPDQEVDPRTLYEDVESKLDVRQNSKDKEV